MRVLVDANVLISYLIVPQQSAISRIMDAALQRRFTLLLPQALLEELVEAVTVKPRLRKRIRRESLDGLVSRLLIAAEILPLIKGDMPIVSRDRKDDYLLAYALVGRADYLITGDEDLLVLGKIGDVLIMRPSDFLLVLEEM